ncbi:MAG: amidase [Alphaproteobacteria bacterium]|nr:amidase [Alphaproteobacteria bacterium]
MSKAHQSAVETANAIRAGRTSSAAAVETLLARIAERDDAVRAWIHLDPEQARAAAKRRDAEPNKGRLHGVPIGIKDIVDTADMPTGYGSAIYAGHRPKADAACVARLRAAGAVILGKTVSTEFAYFTPGKTRNPHHPKHTPGGSSSGSAAAVADGQVALALGTQTAGSVIRPASYCGVFGFKASFGAVDRAGIKPFADSFDTPGWFARDVADLALLAEVLLPGVTVPPAPKDRPRLGYCRTPYWGAAKPAMRATIEQAAERLGAEEVRLPTECNALNAAQSVVMAAEAARAYAPEYADHKPRLGARLVALIEQGQTVTPGMEKDARALIAYGRTAVAPLFQRFDALLAPSAPDEAPEGLGATGDPVFNRLWTALHLPCVNIPHGSGATGLPLGLTLVGPLGGDGAVLATAAGVAALLR